MVTLSYNALQGNAELAGQNQVYIHTGVITDQSTGPSDWRYVTTQWGQADPDYQLTFLGNNNFEFDFLGQTLRDYYSVPMGEEILQLAFVFRTANGNLVGRDTDGSDIYADIYQAGFAATFVDPATGPVLVSQTGTFDVDGLASGTADIELYEGTNLLTSVTGATTLNYTVDGSSFTPGTYNLILVADDGTDTATDTVQFIVLPTVNTANPPAGTEDGINYLSSTSVVLQLLAPNKDFVFANGDFCNWELHTDYFMNRASDGETWWIQLDNLTAGQEYRYQYWVDNELMKIGDVYAEKVLDPWNDPWLEAGTYPGLIDYPVGLTSEPVSVFQTDQTAFSWQNDSWTRPEKEKLIVYELLLRDFLESHTWDDLIDSLDYLENLGITGIELMPVNEFEGNNSWGYNPSFYLAPDKYYGPAEDYKRFVDECHGRGMAVIMDIALNHSFGQNPQVRMYFNPNAGDFGQPTADNPWFFETARHDFNVGFDYDHDSPYTEEFVDRVLAHWVNEYHVDGYRFDLSKGFTSNNTLGNIGAWNAYDQGRVDNLNRIKNELSAHDSGLFLILEHFSDNSEETQLSNDGFMFWGNANHDYTEAALGYTGDFNFEINYQERGWGAPNLLGYMESHDEERMGYKNAEFGNNSGGYDVKDFATSMDRCELAAALFIPVPGPKMIYQFGELGYDYSLNYCADGTVNEACRTDMKPIRWDFLDDPDRADVLCVYSALNKLKVNEPAFSTSDYSLDVWGFGKIIHLNHSSMDVVVAGNFDVASLTFAPGFQQTGTWYEYFSGDELQVTDQNMDITFAPGDYMLWTSVQLDPYVCTTGNDTTSVAELGAGNRVLVSPNPFSTQTRITANGASRCEILDLQGRLVTTLLPESTGSFHWNGQTANGRNVAHGTYLYRLHTPAGLESGRIVRIP